MKIGLVSAYDFAHHGGVVDHIGHLAEHFQKMGHTAKIITPWSGAAPREAQTPAYRIGSVVPIPANGSVARITLSPTVSRRIKTILRTEEFDIIHIHEPLLPALPLTVLRHSHSVNVGTFHAYRQSHLAYFYARPVLKLFFRRLHGRIAVSQSALEFIEQYFSGEYEIIPNGIETSRFGPHVRPIAELRDGRPTILFVGRFNESRKGFKYLLRALPLVRQEVPGARLVVVGSGRPERYRRYLEAHGIDDVVFAGRVSADDLPRYYASADVFCAPSIGRESFGIILLEAMASGLSIVASNIPGYASVVHNGQEGLLAEPKSPRALADALCAILLDRRRREQMGECGLRRSRDYDWEKVSRRVISYYREVAVPERRLTGRVR